MCKVLCALLLAVKNLIFPIWNVVIDSMETHNSKKMMVPSTDSETKETVYVLMIVSTLFSTIRCVGLIVLFLYKVTDRS